jgi:hypothetical protein
MIKKSAACAAMLLISSSLFALDLSVGGGAIFGYSASKSETDPTKVRGDLTVTSPGGDIPPGYYPNEILEMVYGYQTSSFDIGAFGFVDARYVEFSAGYIAQIGKVTDIYGVALGERVNEPDKDYTSHLIILDLLGKYPFTLNEKLSVFPAFGFGVKFAVGGNDYSDCTHDILWGFMVKAGGGLDYNVSEKLYMRSELLFYFQLASDMDAKIAGGGANSIGFFNFEKQDFHFAPKGYYLGPQLKIALGYRL